MRAASSFQNEIIDRLKPRRRQFIIIPGETAGARRRFVIAHVAPLFCSLFLAVARALLSAVAMICKISHPSLVPQPFDLRQVLACVRTRVYIDGVYIKCTI